MAVGNHYFYTLSFPSGTLKPIALAFSKILTWGRNEEGAKGVRAGRKTQKMTEIKDTTISQMKLPYVPLLLLFFFKATVKIHYRIHVRAKLKLGL